MRVLIDGVMKLRHFVFLLRSACVEDHDEVDNTWYAYGLKLYTFTYWVEREEDY
jgi:hypothetical protein